MSSSPKVLEVAMEMAFPQYFLENVNKKFSGKTRECAMSTSVGGIGPLLKDRILEQAQQGVDVIGVSLLYESVWVQVWQEWGQVNLEKRTIGHLLREFLKPTPHAFDLTSFDGKNWRVEVWELDYGGARVFFLSCPPITDVVYPGPKDMSQGVTNPYAWSHEIRLHQSWLVGRGALTLCKKIDRSPDIAILSETPTIFVHHKLVDDRLKIDPFFEKTKYVFNDHTPLEYAHPIWDHHTLEKVKLDSTVYLSSPGWNAHKKTLDVTSLLVGVCDAVYGVAKKHQDVMRKMPSLKAFEGKIRYVTNGVRKEDWQAPEFRHFENLSDNDLLQAKRKYKEAMLEWAWRSCRLWPVWAKEMLSKKTVLWTRRITPYKRLDVLVTLLRHKEWRQRFLNLDLVLFVGGRVHQQDNHAQDMVYDLLDILGKDNDVQQRVIFVDNFNIWEAPLLYQGADAAIMLADDTREASATGFMKAQMNGGAILATADGAIPEFVRFGENANGFEIPYVNGEPTAQGLIEALENFDRVYNDQTKRVSCMRQALSVAENISVARTVREMKDLFSHV